VSLALLAAPEASTGPRDSPACPAAGRATADQFLAEAIGQWESLWQDLDERQRALVAERQRMQRDFQERVEALERQRAGLAAQREQIREEIRTAVAAASSDMAEALTRRWRQTADQRAEPLDGQARPGDDGWGASPGTRPTP
jgi:hypothetical protein